MHALEKLQVYYNNSKDTNIYHSVVGIILQNIRKTADSSIYDLANMCYVSPPTISRLCKRLGYSGYQDLKSDLRSTLKNYTMLNRYVPFHARAKFQNDRDAYLELMQLQIQRLRDEVPLQELDQVISMILKSQKVNFYTHGTVFAEYRMQCDLIMAGHMSEICPCAADQLRDLDGLICQDMVILLFPIVSDGDDVMDIVRRIKTIGAKLAVLTDSYHPQIQQYADYCYSFDGDMGIIDDYRFAMYLNLLSIRFRETVLE